MKFKVCPDCGNNLDHGEVCDCKTKKGAPAATGTPRDNGNLCPISDSILANPYWNVNNLLRVKEILDDTGAMAKDVALVVRDKFPKFNRQLLSQCGNHSEYGIIIHPDGLQAICTAYGISLNPVPDIPITVEDPAPKKPENRKLGRKVYFRVTNADFEIIQKRIQDDGYESIQAWLYAKITELLCIPQNKEDSEENNNE